MKFKFEGERTIAEGGATTVKLTVIVCVELTAPSETTRTVPVYVPGARVEEATDTWRVAGVMPLIGVTLSHEAAVTAVHAKAPGVPVSCTVCGVGPVPW